MAYNPTLVLFSSLKSLFFNNRNNALRFSAKAGASDPGIQDERGGIALRSPCTRRAHHHPCATFHLPCRGTDQGRGGAGEGSAPAGALRARRRPGIPALAASQPEGLTGLRSSATSSSRGGRQHRVPPP